MWAMPGAESNFIIQWKQKIGRDHKDHPMYRVHPVHSAPLWTILLDSYLGLTTYATSYFANANVDEQSCKNSYSH